MSFDACAFPVKSEGKYAGKTRPCGQFAHTKIGAKWYCPEHTPKLMQRVEMCPAQRKQLHNRLGRMLRRVA